MVLYVQMVLCVGWLMLGVTELQEGTVRESRRHVLVWSRKKKYTSRCTYARTTAP